jgi:hypothetical protein
VVGLALLLSVAACDGSYGDARFQSVRQRRSALALVRYLQDDFGNRHNDDARALIRAQYDYLLSKDESTGAAHALLEAAAAHGDPRILIRANAPTLSDDLSPEAVEYFGDRHGWDYGFADGATKAASERFPFESVVFDYEGSYDFKPDARTPVATVDWYVRSSDQLFAGPPNIADLTMPAAPVRGIEIRMNLLLTIPGQEDIVVTSTGRPLEGFRYNGGSLGFSTVEDLYGGMLESAVASAMGAILFSAQ